MERAIRVISVERGHDPRDFTLVAFGGAGPLHGASLAEKLGIPRVLVPAQAGVLSALGLLAADLRHAFVRSLVIPLAEAAPEKINEVFTAFRTRAHQLLANERVAEADMQFLPAADLRYRGQAYELSVSLPDRPLAEEDFAHLAAAFHRAHEDLYGYAVPDEPVELVSLRLTAIGRTPKPKLPQAPAEGSLGEARIEVRPVYFGPKAGWHKTQVFARKRLPAGVAFPGPTIVEGAESTVVIPPGAKARVDPFGNLILEVRSWIP